MEVIPDEHVVRAHTSHGLIVLLIVLKSSSVKLIMDTSKRFPQNSLLGLVFDKSSRYFYIALHLCFLASSHLSDNPPLSVSDFR